VLKKLKERNISIGPSKSFYAFPSIIILGRIIDSFGLITIKKKLKAITKLKFPKTLENLKIFIK
ncbi:hypothetical protein B0H65DRAFT_433267, partial [Neurospora tetraspora]